MAFLMLAVLHFPAAVGTGSPQNGADFLDGLQDKGQFLGRWAVEKDRIGGVEKDRGFFAGTNEVRPGACLIIFRGNGKDAPRSAFQALDALACLVLPVFQMMTALLADNLKPGHPLAG